MFADRVDAGVRLARALGAYANDETAIVLGVPRGGVIVAAEVARALHLPLDVVVASKIGAPENPEFAVGAVDEAGEVIESPVVSVSATYMREAAAERHAEVMRRAALYRGGREPLDIRGRTAIIVDDGIATGLTVRKAVSFLRARGAARIVVAAPVMPPDTKTALGALAEDVVALETPWDFSAVGRWYREFGQTSDAEVIAALRSVG